MEQPAPKNNAPPKHPQTHWTFVAVCKRGLHIAQPSMPYSTHSQPIQTYRAPTHQPLYPLGIAIHTLTHTIALHCYVSAGARVNQHPSSLQHDGRNHAPPCHTTRKYYHTAAHTPSQFPIETDRPLVLPNWCLFGPSPPNTIAIQSAPSTAESQVSSGQHTDYALLYSSPDVIPSY